jgi:hypothetical protein
MSVLLSSHCLLVLLCGSCLGLLPWFPSTGVAMVPNYWGCHGTTFVLIIQYSQTLLRQMSGHPQNFNKLNRAMKLVCV